MTRSRTALAVLMGTVVYLGLAMAARGGPRAFFGEPALVALALATLAMAAAAPFSEGNLSMGVREARGNRWVLPAFGVLGVLLALVPPWMDRRDLWTLGGEGVRWAGVALYAAGGALRMAPVFVLGRRFSGLVAIQPGHALVTTGLYARIRHPSYLGLLVTSLGWALAFRSLAGVGLVLLHLPVLLARIQAEEALLLDEFGAEYEAYRARTDRLIPGLY